MNNKTTTFNNDRLNEDQRKTFGYFTENEINKENVLNEYFRKRLRTINFYQRIDFHGKQ